jgi:hypothetical protein
MWGTKTVFLGGSGMNKTRFLLNVVAGLAVTALGAVSLSAQIAPDEAKGPSAQMVVTEQAGQNSNPPAVSRDDVVVFQGQQRDKVTGWVPAQGEHAALEFFILLDDDSTTSTLGSQLSDIRQFIMAQPSTTKIGIAYMRNGIAWIAQNPTSDHAAAGKALRLPYGSAGSNGSPYFALSDLVKHWPKTQARREVLMISDGVDRYYDQDDLADPYLEQAISAAQRAGIVVSAIYNPGQGTAERSSWRTYLGQVYMTRVAEQTGGKAYYMGFSAPAVAFAPYLKDLSNRLNHQYLLSFVAAPEAKTGLQPVKLESETPNTDLVAADRVFVPAGR